MTINRPFLKLSVVSILFSTVLLANSSMRGSLKSGDEIVLKPKNQYALSITRTRGMSASNSNYDFIMMNNDELVYEDKNQKDDVHLVFHDDIEQGDSIKIHVNRGYFDYKIAPINALPNIVKSVLTEEVLEKAKVAAKRIEKTKNKVSPKKDSQLKSHSVAPKKEKLIIPKTPLLQKETIAAEPVKTPEPKLQSSSSQASPISEGFFDKFTEIFKGIVKSFSMNSTVKKESQTPETKESISDNPKVKEIAKKFDDSALQDAAAVDKGRFNTEQRGLQTTFDDSALQDSAQANKSTFRQTQRGISEKFDDRTLIEKSRDEKKSFNAPRELPQDTYIPVESTPKYEGRGSITEKSYHDNLPRGHESVPRFRTAAPVVSEPIVEREEIPTFQPTPIPEVIKEQIVPPVYREVQQPAQVKMAETYTAPNENAYPDTGYKEGYESLDNSPKVALQESVVEDSSLPSSPFISEDTEDKKLVITKTIDREEVVADPYAGRVLGNINDRVLGNGYDGATSTGKLSMKVSKNSRPVSAWVEVFKNGTKERVKTFYTSKGRTVKSVKLPAGTYMVRATYRSRDSKQQKTINNIRLKEGGSINKSIAFYDGKLRVIARRGDDPLYVKVVAYKSGTRQRVSYDFSSRTSGIAELSLSSGTYDIEVIDHKNNRAFDSIRIRGGKTETINADF